MDIASFLGILVAVLGILIGMKIEGGSIGQITQPTAALIVLGGTTGAVLLQFPLGVFVQAMRQGFRVFGSHAAEGEDFSAQIKRIVAFANRARRAGVLSIDADLAEIADPFLRQALTLAVDGIEAPELRKIMELEFNHRAEMQESGPAVFEAAGGYAPTVGILGAVLGLIQVMQHLDRIDEVGRGIATAFVATIYGVGFANLVCLPAAGKLRIRIREQQRMHEMMLEGVLAILEGINPRMLETRLRTFVFETDKPEMEREMKNVEVAGEA